MAGLHERNGSYRAFFRCQGGRYTFTIGKVSKAEAEAKCAQIDYLVMRIEQGLLEVPPGVDLVDFIRHDGKPPAPTPKPAARLTLPELRDRYLAAYRSANEPNTLTTARVHFGHLVAALGEGCQVAGIQATDLQGYINGRAGQGVSSTTVRKEIATLRAAWNWAALMKDLDGPCPNKGLLYPKTDDKPPFQTREEIERKISRGGLGPKEQAELWECLFLTIPEVTNLLEMVKARPLRPWVYPAFAFVAHTGARRSEMMRALIDDVDFDGESILIREKKRAKGKRTMRRAPLSPLLSDVLKVWLEAHPGGQALFRNAESPDALSEKDALRGFRRAVADSTWDVMRGWHVLRHSFITGCAAAGVDQRLIDDWVGHSTEEMRRRYRHLVPSAQRQAIRAVFG